MKPIIISLICLSIMSGILCNVINPPSERSYYFEGGESITLVWTYEIDSLSEFVRIDCGRVNLTLSASQDKMETLLTASNSQQAQVVQPLQRYATLSGQVNGRRISLTFNNLKSSARGEYKCVLRVYHRGLNGVVKIDSRLTELTTVNRDAQKAEERNMIIGVLVGGIGFIVIIIIIACLMYRRSKGQKSIWLCSREEKMKKKKETENNKKKNKRPKVTKDDIQRTSEITDQRSGSSRVKGEHEPKYAQVQVVSTPEEALNRPYYDDDDSDMKDFV